MYKEISNPKGIKTYPDNLGGGGEEGGGRRGGGGSAGRSEGGSRKPRCVGYGSDQCVDCGLLIRAAFEHC